MAPPNEFVRSWSREVNVIIDGHQVEPLTPDRFDDFVAVIGRGGIGGCWCMYWTHPTTATWGEGCKGGGAAPNRRAFLDLVEAGPPPGLLAYDDGDPVAWCRVMPRRALPGLANSRYFKTDLDIDGVWSLACFVVRRSPASDSRWCNDGPTTSR